MKNEVKLWTDVCTPIGQFWFRPPMQGGEGLILTDDGDIIGRIHGDEAAARAWTAGYVQGREDGEAYGREDVRRAMRNALGMPHPKAEE